MRALELATPKLSKVERYKWTTEDKKPRLEFVSKNLLTIDTSYQRQSVTAKVLKIASSWSWVACGCIIVGHRDGQYYVIDGQHRVSAAMRRADISELPCVVFETESTKEEAIGFLNSNTARKPITSIDKFHASITAGDEVALYVSSVFAELGIKIRKTCSAGKEIKSLVWSLNEAARSKRNFYEVMRLAAEICANSPINEKLVSGMMQIHMTCECDLTDKRLRKRIVEIGVERLLAAANRAAAFYVRGGAKVYADGMLNEINKGLQKKFSFKFQGDTP
jgi:hypothetical protein